MQLYPSLTRGQVARVNLLSSFFPQIFVLFTVFAASFSSSIFVFFFFFFFFNGLVQFLSFLLLSGLQIQCVILLLLFVSFVVDICIVCLFVYCCV